MKLAINLYEHFTKTHRLVTLLIIFLFLQFSNSVFGNIAISNPTSSVGASNVCPSALKVPIHAVNLQGSGGTGTRTITSFSFVANYTPSSVVKFQLYYSNTNNFGTAILLGEITSPGISGSTQTFTGLSLVVGNGSTINVWVTMDVAASPSGTVVVMGTANSNVTTSSGSTTGGPSSASGTQTFVTAPTITLSATSISVCTSSSTQQTSLSYTATTGSPATYSITWNSSPTNSFVAVTDALLPASPITITVPANTTAGIYTGNLTVKNASGCSSTSSVFTVIVGTSISISSSASSVCYGSTSTTLSYSATSGSPITYSISWNASPVNSFATVTDAALPSSPITIAVPDGTRAGTYTGNLTVKNAAGCVSTSTSFTVTVNSLPTITLSSSATSVCTNGNTSLTYSATSGSPTTYSITWNASPSNSFAPVTDAAMPVSSPITIVVPSGTAAGTYTGNLTVKNALGCVSNTSVFTVTVLSSINVSNLTAQVGVGCTVSGIAVSVFSTSLASGTYTVGYTTNGSGNNGTGTATMIFNQVTGQGTFSTYSLSNTSLTSVTITSISVLGCSSGVLNVSAGSVTVSSVPTTNITVTASNADIGNPVGSTITIRSKTLTAGTTYTITYTLVGINGNNYPSTSSSANVTMAALSQGNSKVGTFTTGLLSESGQYQITIKSIAFASTGCAVTTSVSTNFIIQSAFVTQKSGSWNEAGVWGTFGTGPNYLDGNITIAKDHTITMPDTIAAGGLWSLDQFTIYGTLIIQSGMTLTIVNGDGTDLVIGTNTPGPPQTGSISVFGTLVFSGDVTHSGTTSSNVTFNAASIYRHMATTTEGSPPTASWNETSSFNVEGYTTASGNFGSSGWQQDFGNVNWNCLSQTGDINLNGNLGLLSGGVRSIKGNLTISSTGQSGILRLSGTADYSLTIPKDFTISGTSVFKSTPSSGNSPDNFILTVQNLVYNSIGTSWLCDNGQTYLNVRGNVTSNNGTLFLSSGGGTITKSGTTINLTGNLTVNSPGTLDASSSNSGKAGLIIFNDISNINSTDYHEFNNSGNIADDLLYYQIAANHTVRAVGNSPIISSATGTGFGNNGYGFILNSGAKLIVESTDSNGAIQSGKTAGNIRIADASRYYADGSIIQYGNGSLVGTQFISGTGHPSSLGVDCIIDNTNDVTVCAPPSGTLTIGGSVRVVNGDLIVTENNLTVLDSAKTIGGNIIVNTRSLSQNTTTLRVDSVISMTGGNIQFNSSPTVNASNTSLLINGDFDPSGTNYFDFSGANCQVTVAGETRTLSDDFPINAPDTLESLTMNVTGGATTLVVSQNLTLGNFTPCSPTPCSGGTYSGGLTLTNGNVEMNANLVVTTDLTMTNGTLFFEGDSVELQRNIQPSATGLFYADASSTLSITGTFSGNADSLLFESGGNTLGTLILNRSANLDTNIFINTPVIIANYLYLTDGNFFNESGLTLIENATIVRTQQGGFLTGSALPSGGPYNIIYNNYTQYVDGPSLTATSLLTGLESQGYINNLTSNAFNVSVENNVDIHGTLDVNTGSVFDADGPGTSILTLRSTNDNPDKTANVAPLDGSINGHITVQRFMSPELRMYRYLSSPVSDASVADWMDDFPVTGPFKDPSTTAQWDASICGLDLKYWVTSMYFYLESVYGDADTGYQPYPAKNIYSYDSPLLVGRGYVPFIRNCETPTIIDVRGPINRGTIPLPVTFTPHSGAGGLGDGWNLIGNPYPSAIDWSHPSWTKTNIVDAISIMDNGTGIMHYYDGPGGLEDDFSGMIASGQAFWVRATAVSPSLIIQEAAKVNGNGNGHEFYRIASEKSAPAITISLSVNGITDKAHLKVQAGSHIEMDNWDMPKLKNESFGISSSTPNGIPMAISAVPEMKEGLRIPLKLEGLMVGVYSLKFNSTDDFLTYSIELTDRELGIKKIMNWNDSYEVVISPNSDFENRFSAKLVRYQPTSEVEVTNLIAYPNPVKNVLMVRLPPDGLGKSIKVYDQKGLLIEDRIESPESLISEINFTSRPSGVYLIRLVGAGYNFLTKVIKE